ncbi:hypothetical protein BDW66DRAFT_142219 [Aspergillus desertorum]
MCGPSRASSGHRIAIMFPLLSSSPAAASSASLSPSPSPPPPPSRSPAKSYSLFFRQPISEKPENTKAVFQIKDSSTISAFRSCQAIDLRIEYVSPVLSAAPTAILS